MSDNGQPTFSAELRPCPRCGRWTRWLSAARLCRDCTLGWVTCPVHGRLEWERAGEHQRVTVADVLVAIPAPRPTEVTG